MGTDRSNGDGAGNDVLRKQREYKRDGKAGRRAPQHPVHRSITPRRPTLGPRTVVPVTTQKTKRTCGTRATPGTTPRVTTTRPKTATPLQTTTPPQPQTTTRSKTTTQIPLKGAQLAAKVINDSLNYIYEPCNDFYNFVCSRFNAAPTVLLKMEADTYEAIKGSLSSIDVPSSSQSASEKAAALFRACVRLGSDPKSSEVKSLKPFLSQLRLDMSNMQSDRNFDIPRLITQLSVEYGFPTFVKFGLIRKPPDFPNNTLDMRIHKEDEDWMQRQHRRHNNASLALFYEGYVRLYDSNLDSAALATRIVRSEYTVRQFIVSLRRNRTPPTQTTVGKLGSFTRGYVSEAHWLGLITHYTDNVFKGSDPVLIFDNAASIVVLLMDHDRMSRDDSRLLLAWSLLRRLIPLASGQMMASTVSNPAFVPDFCYETVTGVMSLAVTHRYFSTAVPSSALMYAKGIWFNLLSSLRDKISGASWIKNPVRDMLSSKAATMGLLLAYPSEFSNDSLLEAFYASFPDVGPDFFNPYLASHRLMTTRTFRSNVNAQFRTAGANAFYNEESHSLFILAGILQPPVFINDAPAAMNYGALGQILGHETMHAFDIKGITVDAGLRPVNFKNTTTMREYNAKVLCLRASYEKEESKFRARTTDHKTDSEGFVDYAGLLLAHDAYRKLPDEERAAVLPGVGLNAEQTFFVAHCIKWCTPDKRNKRIPGAWYWHRRSRCVVPLQNMPEFAQAFYCRPGDAMNPVNRCSFW
ncbi:neprilysin-1-like [Amblyomma americanum]